MTQKEETILTKLTPASLIKSVQFFLGMAIPLILFWHASTQWQETGREILLRINQLEFKINQLDKNSNKIEIQLEELTKLAQKNEKASVRYEGKIEGLEFRVMTLEKYHRHEKSH